eukprot:CAMPEP_0196578914 /NCGR_PEP_ID=MMETSP1081-20130531/12692_1 /TAXON_ID=36882 /ORGANISM="Pyramimonas amylifera, Strain CCMP720" /LENGTH=129 /DNA_ID=CAMNT_0041898303 /DNA_START=41 /DNA_END=430 /DNA_ORIENTATION=+
MASTAISTVQEKLQTAATDYRNLQKDMSTNVEAKSQFMQQQQENQMVMKELEVLEEDSNVYKLIGPLLIKQDLVEAKSNVGKRLEYIGNEMKRQDSAMKSLENRDKELQEEILRLQTKMQTLQSKAAQN